MRIHVRTCKHTGDMYCVPVLHTGTQYRYCVPVRACKHRLNNRRRNVDFYVEVAAGFEFAILSGLKQRANSCSGRVLGLYVSAPVNVGNVLSVAA